MSLSVYDLSASVFVRGLTNLKALLTKAEAHAAASGSGEAALLNARIAPESDGHSDYDLHMFTLAAQVHWAAESAKLTIARLLGAPPAPAAIDEKSFADLHRRLDATIAYLRELAPNDLEAGLDRTIEIENRRGSMRFSGSQFLLEFALPHFFFHVTHAYGILRNQGVQLTMGDFLGSRGTS
jgi:hypothetical protein